MHVLYKGGAVFDGIASPFQSLAAF